MRLGYLDICMQSHCAGWAVEDDHPAALELFINGRKVSEIVCDIDRPDLVAHGLPRDAGFSVAFATPLGVSDIVDVRFRNGGSLDNSPNSQHADRLKQLLVGISTSEKGLELGPLDRPILGKSNYNVFYVDHASKSDLVEKYKHTGTLATVRPESILHVDFVWSQRLREVVAADYAYCIASHVIEHVTDPIGWLEEISEVLRPGGRINLAVPERTRTFDHRRTPSTAAAMLEAYQRKLRRPSFGQIFDHISGVSPLGGPEPDPVEAAQSGYRVAKAVEASGEYLDVHCHVWSHETFGQCWSAIAPLDLVPLRLVELSMPLAGSNEFIVSFVRE